MGDKVLKLILLKLVKQNIPDDTDMLINASSLGINKKDKIDLNYKKIGPKILDGNMSKDHILQKKLLN